MNFEQLALVLKTEFALKFFTGLKYFLSLRNLSNLRLPWNFASRRGNSPPASRLVRLWTYGIKDENAIFYIAWKMTISKRHE